MDLLNGVRYSYEVGRVVAVTAAYQLCLASEVTSGTPCLLQVASERLHNGGLARAAYILDLFADASRGYDEEYGRLHDGKRLHYDRLFPARVESFEAAELGKRRVNALTFTDVTSVAALLPLANVLQKDRLVLDLKTGAWVMGRLLKLLGFTHEQGVAIRTLGPNNILLDTDQHFAIVLDWTSALMFQEEVDRDAVRHDIACAARTVLVSNGLWGGNVPYSLTADEQRYIGLLQSFARGSSTDAVKAHRQFYDLLNKIWPVEFHPFTTMPL